ncbi:MAG: hypothetical protein ABW275_02300 [Hansschlegelia sp.]
MKRPSAAAFGMLLVFWGSVAAAAEDGPPPPPKIEAPRQPGEDENGLKRARDMVRRADSSGGVDCLNAREARRAIVEKRAVTLAQAVRTARDAWPGEVIDYRLCTYDGRIAYELTLLADDGRVARVRVSASDGALLGVR